MPNGCVTTVECDSRVSSQQRGSDPIRFVANCCMRDRDNDSDVSIGEPVVSMGSEIVLVVGVVELRSWR